MATYFEAVNANGKTVIDDEFRFLQLIGSLSLSGRETSPVSVPYTYKTFVDHNVYYSVDFMQLQALNTWYVLDGRWMSYSAYPKLYVYLKQVNRNHIYGIRFKKASSTPAVYVSMHQTPIGAMITGNRNAFTLMILVYPSDSSLTPAKCMEHFEIVEIGNDADSIPSCTNGIAVYNSAGECIWNTNCNMVDVVATYNGTASNYTYAGGDTLNILIQTKMYRAYDYRQYNTQNYVTYKWDFWRLTSAGLRCDVLEVQPYYQYTAPSGLEPARLWDIRDYGIGDNVYSTPSYGGLIARVNHL